MYANLNTKKEKNKLRRQKLEEAFIIVGDILGGIHYKVALLINPNLNIENPKFEIGKLHSLISFYAPELQEDYKDFMSTYQEFIPLTATRFRTSNDDDKSIKEIIDELTKIAFLLNSKGNIIKEKLTKIAQTL
ncbi:hypothetical protein A3835_05885 [Campylobacter concisus]|uniref:Uncharacterized protein n=1 Tax=Campylobacter concisus TaxID=199 RepID=A0A1X0U176_9BACT|nr:hypothetical protein A3835_05885 [Campylobacter concisus]